MKKWAAQDAEDKRQIFDQGLCPLFKLTEWPLEEIRSIG
jgi:hypothetical protein